MWSGKNIECTCGETLHCIFIQKQAFLLNTQTYAESSIP